MTRIPLFDLAAENRAVRNDLTQAFARVLDTSAFILGAEVSAFEQQVAAYLAVPHAVGLSNGSDALYLALRALGISDGDEVITSPFTFVATAEAILRCGAVPVFADVEPETLSLCPSSAARMRTNKTRAVLTVHLYGHPGTVLDLERFCVNENLPLVEDACQAFGASINGRKLGTIGATGVYSFFPTKPLGGFGDGGLLVTRSEPLAEKVRQLRSHGVNAQGRFESLAGNFRLDGLQAALLGAKLLTVDDSCAKRRSAAKRYHEAFARISHIVPPRAPDDFVESAWSLYTVRVPRHRNALLSHLSSVGIEGRAYYSSLLSEHPLFAGRCRSDALTSATAAAAEVLSLPLYAGLTLAQQQQVIDAITTFKPTT